MRRGGGVALCAALLIACGGDDSSPASDERDASSSDAAEPSDTSASDASESDASDASEPTDVRPDAAGDASSSDAAADAADDAPSTDVGEDAAVCLPGGDLGCFPPCNLDFSGFAEDRDGLVVFTLVAEGGPLSLTSLSFDEASPLVRFSSGWLDYVARITDDAWSSADDGQTLDTGGVALPLPDGALEVEIAFDAPDGDATAGCPSGARAACGELVIEWQDCDGSAGDPVRLPIRR